MAHAKESTLRSIINPINLHLLPNFNKDWILQKAFQWQIFHNLTRNITSSQVILFDIWLRTLALGPWPEWLSELWFQTMIFHIWGWGMTLRVSEYVWLYGLQNPVQKIAIFQDRRLASFSVNPPLERTCLLHQLIICWGSNIETHSLLVSRWASNIIPNVFFISILKSSMTKVKAKEWPRKLKV